MTKLIDKIFDENGNFLEKEYDPYRLDPKFNDLHNMIFDLIVDGYEMVNEELLEEVDNYASNHKLDASCDMNKLIEGADTQSKINNGTYTAIDAWK